MALSRWQETYEEKEMEIKSALTPQVAHVERGGKIDSVLSAQ